jgi:hypothetical protein
MKQEEKADVRVNELQAERMARNEQKATSVRVYSY